jgi:hypothetical protein
MRLWRRVLVPSPMPCRHVVHMMMLTKEIRKKELINFVEVKSTCPTIQSLVGPHMSTIMTRNFRTLDSKLPPRIFQHCGHVVPLCCRRTMHAVWKEVQRSPPH